MAEPLTPEEEEAVRAGLAHPGIEVAGKGNDNPDRAAVWYTPDCGYQHLSNDGNASLTCPDRHAASQGDEGLREALEILRADAHDSNRTADWRYGVRHTLTVIERALAAEEKRHG